MVEGAETDQEELLRRIRAGDEAAWTALYRRHQGRIFRYALRMSGSAALAEDVTQEVFMALLRGLDRIDLRRGTLGAYLLGTARRQTLRQLERRRPSVPLLDEPDPERAPGAVVLADESTPFETVASGEQVERVRHALLALPEGFREPVVLCDLEGMSYAEAAALIGVPLGTVRSRLHRGRRLLGQQLSAELGRAELPREETG